MSEPLKTNEKRVVGTACPETIQVEKMFRKLEIGDTITYSQINQQISGIDIQDRHRGYAATAISRCEADSIFIRCVTKEGWIRVADSKAVDLTDDAISRTGKLLRKTSRTLARVDYDKLDGDHKRKHNVNAAVVGTMAMFTKPRSIRAVEAKVNDKQIKPSMDEMLALFNK